DRRRWLQHPACPPSHCARSRPPARSPSYRAVEVSPPWNLSPLRCCLPIVSESTHSSGTPRPRRPRRVPPRDHSPFHGATAVCSTVLGLSHGAASHRSTVRRYLFHCAAPHRSTLRLLVVPRCCR